MSEKILLAKGGKDGHTTGIVVLSHALTDAGMEVILPGLYVSAEEIVDLAIQKDVDVVGLSQLDGNHMGPFKRVAELLKEKGLNDVLLIGGGIIPPSDIVELENIGFKKVFRAASSTDEVVEFIRHNVEKHRSYEQRSD